MVGGIMVPSGVVALLAVGLLVFFGLAHRVLDRMRLTDAQALVAIGLLIAGSFVDIPVLRGPLDVRVNVGGAILPVVLTVYLLVGADSNAERVRSLVGAAVTAAAVLAVASWTDFDPGRADFLDPLWLFSGVGGLTGYIVGGRSRRASFIAGSMGLLLTDLVHVVRVARSGMATSVLIGGAGAFDMVVLAGLIAVGLAEAVGETRERLSGGPGKPGLAAMAALSAGLALFGPSGDARAGAPWKPGDERTDGGYYVLTDDAGRVMTFTARVLGPGDSYIDASNVRWEVARVEGNRVVMRRVGQEPMPSAAEAMRPAPPIFPAAVGQAPGARAGPSRPIAIYFTHSDESYVPTSGQSSKPWGDIYQVGERLAESLRRHGYQVVVSHHNHNPHDGQAYLRSRRTAAQLLRAQPVALVDVHRDAVPPQVYETKVEGQPAVKVRLVVGRQNPHMATNLTFAKRMKAVADRQLPGIIEGIFLAQGDYNQDLTPRSILLEFGAHTNPLEMAEAAAEMFAPVIPQAAGAAPGTAAPAGRALGGAAWRTAIALITAFVLGALAYLAINSAPGQLSRWLEQLRSRVRIRMPGDGGSDGGGGGSAGGAGGGGQRG